MTKERLEILLYNALIMLADEQDVTIEELKKTVSEELGMTEQEFDCLFDNE